MNNKIMDLEGKVVALQSIKEDAEKEDHELKNIQRESREIKTGWRGNEEWKGERRKES